MMHFMLPKKTMNNSDSSFKRRLEIGSKKMVKFQDKILRQLKAYLGQPRKVVRILVFVACSITVLFQLAQCFKKLTSPPISTHSKVLINTTMTYPSITICRSPAYRKDVLKKYGLGSSLRWTSEWKNFPFGNRTLTAFWSEATYTQKDIISVYGLNRRTENVDVKSHMSYMGGQCHTLVPLVATYSSGTSAGYSLILKHTEPDASDAGWLVYIHEANEIWTETGPQFSGMYEVFWMEANEELDLKIAAHHIKTISQKDRACVTKRSYSEAKCKSLCRWRLLVGLVGCTGPWILPIGFSAGQKMGVKECDNYQDTRELIRQYMLQTGLSSITNLGNAGENETEDDGFANTCQGTCLRPCHETQYTTFLMNRKPFSGVQGSSKARSVRSLDPLDMHELDPRGKLDGFEGGRRIPLSDKVPKNSSADLIDCTGSRNCSDQLGNIANSSHRDELRVVNPGIPPCCGNTSGNHSPKRVMNQSSLSGSSPDEESTSDWSTVVRASDSPIAYSTLKVFYTSKVVSSMEEHWGYDFTQFVADAGGSLGFILGMSVVGAVAILEQLAESLVDIITGRDQTLCEGGESQKKSSKVDGAEGSSMVPYEGMKH